MIHAFRPVPRTGVIYVMTEAAKRGYDPRNPDWANLGQGMPETGPLSGAPPRRTVLEMDPADLDYAPIPGIWELREGVAGLYNERYRRGLPSRYTAENVAIAGGGRPALTRVAATLGPHQPRPLPAGLHGVRGAARHLPDVHLDLHPSGAGAGLRLVGRRPEARDPRTRPGGTPRLEPHQPQRRSSGWGSTGSRLSSSPRLEGTAAGDPAADKLEGPNFKREP